jgi:anti-anti-sigma factor
METRVLHDGGSYAEIAMIGAFDFATASDMAPLLKQLTSRGVPVILDVSQLSYMSSMAIGVLMKAQQALAKLGGMVLLSPPPEIEQLLLRSRIERIIPIVKFRHEALRQLGLEPRPAA